MFDTGYLFCTVVGCRYYVTYAMLATGLFLTQTQKYRLDSRVSLKKFMIRRERGGIIFSVSPI